MDSFRHLTLQQVFGESRARLFVNAPSVQGDHFAHDHDFLEIALVERGYGMHASVHGKQKIARGDLFVLRPGAWHGYLGCRNVRVYNCCCALDLLRRELSFLADAPSVNRLLWTEPLAEDARGLLHKRLAEEETAEVIPLFESLKESAGEPFLTQTGRLIVLLSRLGSLVFPNEPAAGLSGHPTIQAAIRTLEEGYADSWSLGQLAGTVYLSPAYLVRLFKESTGSTPMAYLARYRAERAARLLLATEEPVGEIGHRVGWPDANYFARRFKAVFGVSPSAYRSQRSGAANRAG